MSGEKRRRIVVEDEEDDDEVHDHGSLGSNPDELLSDNNSDEEGEDLMNENWLEDYAPAPELDYYDASMLAKDDDVPAESYEMRLKYRRAAEEAMELEDERRRRIEDEADDLLEDTNKAEAAELLDWEEEDEEDDLLDEGEKSLNLEAFQCPLREWIAEERTRREVKRRFRKFLLTYYVGKEERESMLDGDAEVVVPKQLPPVYRSKIRAMCASNNGSLEVSYLHIGEMQSLLAIWLTDVPRDMLEIFDEVLLEIVLEEFPHYNKIVPDIHVRVVNLPIADRLRDLRQKDLNNLIRVCGVVTRRTGVCPQLRSVAYTCTECSQILGPYKLSLSSSTDAVKPKQCPVCTCSALTVNPHKSVYGNFQRLTLQESPGSVEAGRVPRTKDVIVLGDLIDVVKPGEEVEVTGIYCQANTTGAYISDRSGFPVLGTVIEANHVLKKNSATNSGISEEDRRKIRELANDPKIRDRIVHSIAPSIFGHDHVKTAVALSLFGGCIKETSAGGHRVRGDINVLLLGDPGTAKSQILKHAEKVCPRAVYTTGKGASAVGLTAGVRRDGLTKEWTLEGGALVLADQGMCLIDEFDKMNEQDRTSIHEAMEQQTISVSKAGIVTSLQARCAVLAAANPIGGRYDSTYTFAENVELTDPILQRFDILCVLQDVVNPVTDEQLALFVVNSHMKSHPNSSLDEESASAERTTSDIKPIEQNLLKKYILYAKNFVRPLLLDVDIERIAALYGDLRRQSLETGGVPIAVRHIESVMRISEASARMHLRDHVRQDDVDLAIKVMLDSFSQAQKLSVRKTLLKSFRKYIVYGEEANQLLMHQLEQLVLREEQYNKIRRRSISNTTHVQINELENSAKQLNIFDLRPFFTSSIFKERGFRADELRGMIIKSY